MDGSMQVPPLSYTTRRKTFLFLVLVFVLALPFLYLYATGYRFDVNRPTNLVSTGGMYIAVDRTGAEIYIDDELMRETRAFRRAFYAQNLDAGTHRVHVQKDGYHTWVKELPVSRRLVTEAEAFNLPVVPQVRVISKWQTATGTMVITSALLNASTTNAVIATTTLGTSTLIENSEFVALLARIGTSSTSTLRETPTEQLRDFIRSVATSTSIESEGTTTVVSGGAKLFTKGDELYATWIGSFEQMPYYYCAPDFPVYSSSSPEAFLLSTDIEETELSLSEEPLEVVDVYVMHPVQSVPKDAACDPTVRIDTRNHVVTDFDFLPNSADFVLLVQDDGIFVVEVDDRAWQNVQPLIQGDHLILHIENGGVYVYDGVLFYQIMLEV